MAATKLTEGSAAPGFSISDNDSNQVSLSTLEGKKVILYFYPAASAPGSTIQACDFRGNMASLQNAGYEVLGVSKDRGAALQKFATEENLGFHLLSDPDLAVHVGYGA